MVKSKCSGGLGRAWVFLFKTLPPFEAACVLHDSVYGDRACIVSRHSADLKLRARIHAAGHPVVASIAYWAVRAFGWQYYHQRTTHGK